MTTLAAPQHIQRRGGPLWQLRQARAARAEWVAARRREGHTLREIADALGISAPAVWKISNRARRSGRCGGEERP